jgi:hypothetical protein
MKKTNPLRPQDAQWIADREWWFCGINRTLPREDLLHLYAILSWVDGRTRKPGGCGRCLTTARQRLWQLYLTQKDKI